MRILPITGLFLALFACAACTEEMGSGSLSDPFLGKWSCAETRTLSFATPAGSPDAIAMARSIVVVGTSNGMLATTAESEAGVNCRLDLMRTGSHADLSPGQTCTAPDGISLVYTNGTADLGDTGLKWNLVFDFAGSLAVAAGTQPVDARGNGTAVSTCSKVAVVGSTGATGGGGW